MNTKLTLLTLVLLLQGCTQEFNEKYNPQTLVNSDSGVQSGDELKQSPFMKYKTAFLGKAVDYSEKKQALLAKSISINTFAPTELETVFDIINAQSGTSYRIDRSIPGSNTEMAIIEPHTVSFTGRFDEFLRYISALYDVSIQVVDDHIIDVKAYNTYAIKLDFYGSDNTFEASMDLSGNEATASGGVKGKSEIKFKSTFWDDVKDMAEKYVSSKVYNIFKDASILTYSGRPSENEVLSRVLKEYQSSNSRQFVVTYKIFTLDKSKIKNLGAGVNASYKNGGTSFGINTSLMDTLTGGLSVGRDFYSGTDPKLNISAQLDAVYNLTGSKVLQSGTFVTRNNVPVPLNLTRSQYFVSGRTQTTNSLTSVVDTEIETSQIITGTSFIVTPRVLSDGRIEVASGFTKRFLNSIDTFEKVQLPNVTTTEMFNTSIVTPGGLLLVGKYNSNDESDNQSAMLLGGSLNRDDKDSTIVMIVGIDYYRAPFIGQ
ncbi:type II and III secretion system protein [Citrobacter meridianamericanus]|uniref:type II and III secretion system protein n=1 Tax=Citrobacter meridianamericanus TaxID=2894201 RepID=UPI00351CDA16